MKRDIKDNHSVSAKYTYAFAAPSKTLLLTSNCIQLRPSGISLLTKQYERTQDMVSGRPTEIITVAVFTRPENLDEKSINNVKTEIC